MSKPRWWQWSYVETLGSERGGRVMARVVVRTWHPGFWIAVALNYLWKTLGRD